MQTENTPCAAAHSSWAIPAPVRRESGVRVAMLAFPELGAAVQQHDPEVGICPADTVAVAPAHLDRLGAP